MNGDVQEVRARAEGLLGGCVAEEAAGAPPSPQLGACLACWRYRGQVGVPGAEEPGEGVGGGEVEGQWDSDPAGPRRIFCRVRWESSEVLSRGVEESDFVLRESSWLWGEEVLQSGRAGRRLGSCCGWKSGGGWRPGLGSEGRGPF